MMRMGADEIAGVLRSRYQLPVTGIEIAWLCLPASNREEFAQALDMKVGGNQVIPVVHRDKSFRNLNLLVTDVDDLLRAYQASIVSALVDRGAEGVVFLVISRSELEIASVSSKAVLPEWYPRRGGEECIISVTDVLSQPLSSLSDSFVDVGAIGRALYDLEGQLLQRLVASRRANHNHSCAFIGLLLEERSAEKIGEVLGKLEAGHAEVGDPEAFRPSARDGKTLISRVVRLLSGTKLSGTTSVAKALSDALVLDDDWVERRSESLFSIVLRPTDGERQGAVSLARSVLVTIYAAFQFITAAHHAAEYGLFSSVLLRSVSDDLVASLDLQRQQIYKLADLPEPKGRE